MSPQQAVLASGVLTHVLLGWAGGHARVLRRYIDKWRYLESGQEKKKGFLTSDFSKRDEFSNTVRTLQWREQLSVSLRPGFVTARCDCTTACTWHSGTSTALQSTVLHPLSVHVCVSAARGQVD